jgi:hypothetical protein
MAAFLDDGGSNPVERNNSGGKASRTVNKEKVESIKGHEETKPKSSLIDPLHFKAPMVGKTIFPSYTSDGHLSSPQFP